MGDAAAPHDLTHGLVILRILDPLGAVEDDVPKQTLRDLIGQMVAQDRREIALGAMHEDVRHPGADLIPGQGHGQLRIHDGKFAAVEVRPKPALCGRVDPVVGQHRGIAGLAARGGNGEDGAHGQAFCQLGAGPEIPDVMLRVRDCVRHALRGVQNAAAADPQNEIRPKADAGLGHFPGCGDQRIRNDAAQRQGLDPIFPEIADHAIQQTAFLCGCAAVDRQHPAPAVLFHQFRGAQLRVRAEDDLRWSIVNKLLHVLSSVQFQIRNCYAA